MSRRFVLGFALVALLAVTAGCSADGSLSMEPVDDRELAEEASIELPENADAGDEALVARAIENGTATAVGQRPPVVEQTPFRYGETFYTVNHTEVGTEPGHEVDVRIDFNASSVDGEVVDYEDLPSVDRRLLADALERSNLPENRLEPGYDFGVGGTYTEAESESSALVGERTVDAVRYEGETYPIEVDVEATTLTVYRYEATTVAESPESYASQLRERYAFTLSGLSEAERSVVSEARNGSFYAEDDDNEGFASLVSRFRDRRAVEETDYDGSYVVRYDGQLYWAEMNYGSYDEE
jgi:hypothetical protein